MCWRWHSNRSGMLTVWTRVDGSPWPSLGNHAYTTYVSWEVFVGAPPWWVFLVGFGFTVTISYGMYMQHGGAVSIRRSWA